MITSEQQKWLDHLSDTNQVKVVPFDSSVTRKFEILKKKIQNEIGADVKVELHGASSMGISGQGELDVYLPVLPSDFNELVFKLVQLFGSAGSVYDLERARFVTEINGTKAEVFVINQESKGWLDCLQFEKYLKTHPEALNEYSKLKEAGNGLSTRAYYTQKIEFINRILFGIGEESTDL